MGDRHLKLVSSHSFFVICQFSFALNASDQGLRTKRTEKKKVEGLP